MLRILGAMASLICVAGLSLVTASAAFAQESSSIGVLPTVPPRLQTIEFFEKTEQTDFTAPGLGAHLRYFPAFGSLHEEDEFLKRTDCEGCVEHTPDFGNFSHHTPVDFVGRTFSPDAGGEGAPGDLNHEIKGVRTAGGEPGWDSFTILLPDGTEEQGLSGTTYDLAACGDPNNSVNRLRINSENLHGFCLNIITDNTNGKYNPNVRLEARSDSARQSIEPQPAGLSCAPGDESPECAQTYLDFDGQTDMYTFRYMGMSEGDIIKIKLESEDGASCEGAGMGGFMVSELSTCLPEAGTCTPSCEGRVCGDDGCGGSCGTCPQPDTLSQRLTEVTVTVVEDGVTLPPKIETGVETAVEVGDRLSATLDSVETELSNELRKEFKAVAILQDHRLRNFKFTLDRIISVDAVAVRGPEGANGEEGELTFDFSILLDHFKVRADLKPEGTSNARRKTSTDFKNVGVFGKFGPLGVPGVTPDFDENEMLGLAHEVHQDIDDNEYYVANAIFTSAFNFATMFGGFGPIPQLLLGAQFAPQLIGAIDESTGGDIDDYLEEVDLYLDGIGINGLPEQLVILPEELLEELIDIEGTLEDELAESFGEQAGEVFLALLPGLGTLPASIEIAGTDYSDLISDRLLNPQEGDHISIVYDESDPQVISGPNDPTLITEYATLTLQINEEFTVVASLRNEDSPEIKGEVERAYYAANGEYTVEGWACVDGLPESVEVGLFVDGYAIKIANADLAINASEAGCSTAAGFSAYGFSLALDPEELGGTNVWENKITVIAGHRDFLRTIGVPPIAEGGPWPHDGLLPSDPDLQFVGDFNADDLDDLLWFDGGGARVALSDGTGFGSSSVWLGFSGDPVDPRIADFNSDGQADLIWYDDGEWVALSNGNGFGTPSLWLGPGYNSNTNLSYIADFNHDDQADLMFLNGLGGEGEGWFVALSNGNGFGTPTRWLSSFIEHDWTFCSHFNEDHAFVKDIDGDGNADYMYYLSLSVTYERGWYVALSTGDGFLQPTRWFEPDVNETFIAAEQTQAVADFNGDGFPDYLRSGGHPHLNWEVALSSGEAFGAPTVWLAAADGPGIVTGSGEERSRFFADFDGDGMTDFLFWNRYYDSTWMLARSNGEGFDPPVEWFPGGLMGGGASWSLADLHVGNFADVNYPSLLLESNGWNLASTLLPERSLSGPPDADGDNVPDVIDNCQETPNQDQLDVDGDGFGNLCDGDLDGNGAVTASDFGLFLGTFGAAVGDPAFNSAADFSPNGHVSADDFGIFLGLYPGVPGPSAFTCLGQPGCEE